MSYVAIDIGASFIKGALVYPEKSAIGQCIRLPFAGFRHDRPPSYREVDIDLVLEAVKKILQELCQGAEDINGVFVCGQMHGLVLSNARGQALSDFISWQDRRALDPHPSGQGTYFDLLSAQVTPAERAALGNELRPGLPLCTLWVLSEKGALPSEQCFPASLPDFVAAHLCGVEPRTGATNAAAHGAFDIVRRVWHVDVIARLGLDHLAWPGLQEFSVPVGALRIGRSEVPCYTPVGDQQAALAGSCLGEDEISVNVGTGSQVSMLSKTVGFGECQTRPYFDHLYINTVTHIPAGRALNALLRLLLELPEAQGLSVQDPWRHIIESVGKTPSTDLVVSLNFFPGVFGREGFIEHMHEENLNIGHLFRAAFERMAENYHKAAVTVSGDRPWRRVVFSGGLVHKIPDLRDTILRRMTPPEWRMCTNEDDTLLGLLALSLVVSGDANSVSAAGAIVRAINT